MDKILRSAWAEIDLGCIQYNIQAIKHRVGNTQIIGVVKADGYGHGAVEVSRVLLKNDVSALAVATLDEAIQLRDANIEAPIILLGLAPASSANTIIDCNLTPIAASYSDIYGLSTLALKRKKTVEVFIALETGMGRIGYMHNKSSINEIKNISTLPNIKIKGVFSHLAAADEKDKSFSYKQIEMFNQFCDELDLAGIKTAFRTLANSAATIELPDAWFDAVRPGIILYGCYPSNEINKEIVSLKPAMSLKANIVFIKKVPAGTSISYGRNFITRRESLIATLPLGYADGYPRYLSGKGRVLINGQYAPLVGNICMDQCMIDVTDIPNVKRYDEVILIGSQGGKTILADEIAEKTGTINYEIVSRIGKRLPRIYVSSNS